MAADTLDQAKTKVTEAVDRLADDLEKISHQIHANPELCFKEEQGGGLAERLPRAAGSARSSAAWAGCPPRSARP